MKPDILQYFIKLVIHVFFNKKETIMRARNSRAIYKMYLCNQQFSHTRTLAFVHQEQA